MGTQGANTHLLPQQYLPIRNDIKINECLKKSNGVYSQRILAAYLIHGCNLDHFMADNKDPQTLQTGEF